MASTPPGPGLPPGLTPLNLERVKEVKTHSAPASAAVSPSSPGNISPIEVVALSPLGSLSTRPGSNGSSERNGRPHTLDQYPCVIEKEGCTTSRSVEPIERPIPRSALLASFSLPQLGSRASPFFFRHKPSNKEKEKEEKRKIKSKKEMPLLVNDKCDMEVDYPLRYKGFLETYPAQFSDKLRRILGINSFVDVGSIGLFYPHIMDLDMERKVLISTAGIIRLAGEKKIGSHKNLLKNLCQYDRSMSYWLSQEKHEDAYNLYRANMKKIFFEEGPPVDIYGVFENIPKYGDLDNKIKMVVAEEKYGRNYNILMNSFKEYEDAFHMERHLASLKESVAMNLKDIAQCENDNFFVEKLNGIINETKHIIKNVELALQEKNMQLIPGFTKEFNLKFTLFAAFRTCRQDEACEIPPSHVDAFHKGLPLWDEDLLCQENILKVCLYFFATLCKRRLRFYNMEFGEELGSIYISEKFRSDFEKIKTVKRFEEFMREQKKVYDHGQVEIVLRKTLEYIHENTGVKLGYINEDANIKIDIPVIIKAALTAANDQFPLYKEGSFYNYSVEFFQAAIQVIYKELLKVIEYDSKEPLLIEGSERSGPAPRM